MIDLNFVARSIPLFAEGLKITIALSLLGILGALTGGVIVLAGTRSRFWIYRAGARAFIEAMRNTPVLIQMFLIYFGLASFGLTLSAFESALLALVLQNSAYISEVYRVGIESVSRRQMEAALALGMMPRPALLTMIVPQALRRIIPPLGNQFVVIIKDSSIASTITVYEMTQVGKLLLERTAAPYEIFATLALLYLMLTTVTLFALKILEYIFPVRT